MNIYIYIYYRYNICLCAMLIACIYLYIYTWPVLGGVSSWIWCVCWNCHKLYCFHKWYPKNPYKKQRCWRSKSGEVFSFEIIMAGTFPTVHHVETQQRQHPVIPTPFPSGFLDSLLLAFLESVLTLRSNCAVKWLCQKEHHNFKCQNML